MHYHWECTSIYRPLSYPFILSANLLKMQDKRNLVITHKLKGDFYVQKWFHSDKIQLPEFHTAIKQNNLHTNFQVF